ncbi:Heat stress transcription factor A-1b [Porphyridium purpureum]|uniref:Heat stress transcription factor A-1b n=1 Tax=Porphyridium purpureum TaxID=35688 RepID=A0A5J4Z9N3_PORPP|nr:Heat stress transcription factor A-1b [Porphyridium purpureum]|eukprot:POR8058..scf295_1
MQMQSRRPPQPQQYSTHSQQPPQVIGTPMHQGTEDGVVQEQHENVRAERPSGSASSTHGSPQITAVKQEGPGDEAVLPSVSSAQDSVPPTKDENVGASPRANQPAHAPSGHQIVPPFLVKLYDFVEDPSLNAVISWNEGGESFTVHRPNEFAMEVLPKYFKHNNFSSFVRQLNQYGFRKVHPDRWNFAHEHFQRKDKDQLRLITRKRAKHPTTAPSDWLGMYNPLSSGGGVLWASASGPPPSLNMSDEKAVVELGNYGVHDQVEGLRRDKDLLLRELVATRQAEKNLRARCENSERRIESLENDVKQMQQFIFHFYSHVLSSYPGGSARTRKRLMAPPGVMETSLDASGGVVAHSVASSDALVNMQPVELHALGRVDSPSPSLFNAAPGVGPSGGPAGPPRFPPAVVQEVAQSHGTKRRRTGGNDSSFYSDESADGPDFHNDAATGGRSLSMIEYHPASRLPPIPVPDELDGNDLWLRGASDDDQLGNLDFEELDAPGHEHMPNPLMSFPPLTSFPPGTDMEALIDQIQQFDGSSRG